MTERTFHALVIALAIFECGMFVGAILYWIARHDDW